MASTPTFRATGTMAHSTTSAISPGLPAGMSAGDVVIMSAVCYTGGTLDITTNGSIGTWNLMSDCPVDVALGDKLYVWWGVYSSGSTAPTITPTSGNHILGRIVAYYNVNGVSPIDVTTTGTETTSDTSFSWAPGISTTINNELVICVTTTTYDRSTGDSTAAFTTMTNASLSSIAERIDNLINEGNGGGIALDEGLLASYGSVGTWACTYNFGSSPKSYICFALKGSDPITSTPTTLATDITLYVPSIILGTVCTPTTLATAITLYVPTVTVAAASSSVTFYPVASSDDGFSYAWDNPETIGTIYSAQNGLYVGNYSGGLKESFWVRYKITTTIPQGTTITSAHEHLSGAGDTGTGLAKVYGHDADNPSSPTTFAEYLAIPLTAASVDWDVNTTTGYKESPDLTDIIQELVDDHELTADDYILILHKDDGSGSGVTQIWYAWDYNTQSDLPYLDIEYSSAASPVTSTPETLALAVSLYVPTVSTPVVVTPDTLNLAVTLYIPTVSTPVVVAPETLALIVTAYIPVVSTPVVVTPSTLTLVVTPYIPVISTPVVVTPDTLVTTITTYIPVVITPVVSTPTTLSLDIVEYIPTVITPIVTTIPTLPIATTYYEPTISVSIIVTPTTLPITIAFRIPTVTTGYISYPTFQLDTFQEDSFQVELTTTSTPETLSITLSTFVPTVVVSDNKTFTPTTLSLAVTTYIPTVVTPVLVTPTTLTLSVVTYVPTISTPIVVTPTTLNLLLTSYVPTIVTPVIVTPSTLALSIVTYVPTVYTPLIITPYTLNLVLTSYIPIVLIPNIVVPSTLSIIITSYAPTVVVAAVEEAFQDDTFQNDAFQIFFETSFTPVTLPLVVTTYAPTVTAIGTALVIPETLALAIVSYEPQIVLPQLIVVPTLGIVSTLYAPTILIVEHTIVTPDTLNLVITTYPPYNHGLRYLSMQFKLSDLLDLELDVDNILDLDVKLCSPLELENEITSPLYLDAKLNSPLDLDNIELTVV